MLATPTGQTVFLQKRYTFWKFHFPKGLAK